MISLKEVMDIQNVRTATNHDSYKIVLAQCMEAIRMAAPFATHADFSLPMFIPSRPIYDTRHAMRYVRDKLEYHGFRVTQTSPFSLSVDWSHAKRVFVAKDVSIPQPPSLHALDARPAGLHIAKPRAPALLAPPGAERRDERKQGRLDGKLPSGTTLRKPPPLPSPASSTAGLISKLDTFRKDVKRLNL